MAIDLTACVDCNACVIACQAENNIPVVGKEQVLAQPRDALAARRHLLRRRARSIRHAYYQPVPCMQCENAPCEAGLSGAGDQSQQRRPERHGLQPLRRHALLLEQLPVQSAALQFLPVSATGNAAASKLQRNPDVTVRSRGVMEKCTYCVQRISEAEIDAGKRGPPDPRRRDLRRRASRPARRRRSSSATSTTRRVASRS